MLITKISKLTGIEHTREIPVSEYQLRAWMSGTAFIQDAMPELCPEDREFILSGITPEEWDAVFGEEA